MKQVYLLTGRPGTGKTSLIKEIIARSQTKAGGFYTEEIRSQGIREGFRLVTLDGESAILAHVKIDSPYCVSKYGVNIDALERVGVPALHKAAREANLVIIDEIGKMELFSVNFRETIFRLIDRGTKILGTIMLNPNPWADRIKRHPQVNLITITRDNREQALAEIMGWLEATNSLKT